MFDQFVYFQVPQEPLLFVIPAFGGMVSCEGDGAPFGDGDENITHQVCCSCKMVMHHVC